MRAVTISEAARQLEIGEWSINNYVRKGDLEVIGRDTTRMGHPKLVRYDDVVTLGRRLRLGKVDRDRRTVLLVDDGRMDDIAGALAASGLVVKRGQSILGAIALDDNPIDDPILVMPTPESINEQNLLRAMVARMHLVFIDFDVIGSDPHTVKADARFEYDAPRHLVRWIWERIDERE